MKDLYIMKVKADLAAAAIAAAKAKKEALKNQTATDKLNINKTLELNSSTIETNDKPIETEAKPIESEAKPIESEAKPIESEAKPVEIKKETEKTLHDNSEL